MMGRWGRTSLWVGAGLSVAGLWLALRDVEVDRLGEAFAQADYRLVLVATGLQLAVVLALALRWRLLFTDPPALRPLISALFVAQLANVAIPLRIGMFVRGYLVARDARRSKLTVLATITTEKAFDGLVLALLCAVLLPALAPEWLAWVPLRSRAGWLLLLLLVLVVTTHQRHRLVKGFDGLLRQWPWAQRVGLVRRLEAGLGGMAALHGVGPLSMLWASSLGIAGMGVLVNYAVLRAFHIDAPLMGAALLLVALQIGSRILPGVPLGGIGVFQYISVQALALYDIQAELAVSFGLVLYFIVMFPGALLGAIYLYRMHDSLRRLEREAMAAKGV